MGKTFKKQSSRYDDEFSSKRSGKHAKHANNRKTGGMKTLNSYVEEELEYDDDPFSDDIEITDEIYIQHTQDDTK